MNDVAVLEIQKMRREFENLIARLSPWVHTDEMCMRYSVAPVTLRRMELRGDIPTRVNGRWTRSELMQWESRKN